MFGQWPATPGYSRLGWSAPGADEGQLKVTTSGAVTLTFSFNQDDEISRVVLEGGYGSGAQATRPRPDRWTISHSPSAE